MIKYSDVLSLNDLMSLFNREILVYAVKNYHRYDNLEAICDYFLNQKTSSYEYEKNIVSHIGNSSYEIDNDPESSERYYNHVEENYRIMQQVFSPAMTPIDYIHQHFNQIWQPGFRIENFHHKKMFAGLVRVIHQGSAIHAHQDLVAWSNPKAVGIEDIKCQFGMNYFLKVPKEGGRLFLWNKHINQEEFYQRARGNFCIPISELPPPDISIKPEVGMLILLNSQHLHAIEASVDASRIASSCFIAYRGEDKPLTYWT